MHYFDQQLAAKYGLPEAVLIRHIAYWTFHNYVKGQNQHDGKSWTYSTLDEFVQFMPYFTKDKIRHIISKLEKAGVVVKGNYNDDRRNSTVWYALNDEKSIWSLHSFGMGNKPSGDGKNPILGWEKSHPYNKDTNTVPDTVQKKLDKKNTIPVGKKLEDVVLSDLTPWLEQQKSDGINFTGIDIQSQLAKCKAHFMGKQRKINTVYKWLLNALEFEKKHASVTTQRMKPAGMHKTDAPVIGSPAWQRQQQELGLL